MLAQHWTSNCCPSEPCPGTQLPRELQPEQGQAPLGAGVTSPSAREDEPPQISVALGRTHHSLVNGLEQALVSPWNLVLGDQEVFVLLV